MRLPTKKFTDCCMELARRLIPSVQDEDDLGYFLWNETSFPFGTVLQIARQLKIAQTKIALDTTGKIE